MNDHDLYIKYMNLFYIDLRCMWYHKLIITELRIVYCIYLISWRSRCSSESCELLVPVLPVYILSNAATWLSSPKINEEISSSSSPVYKCDMQYVFCDLRLAIFDVRKNTRSFLIYLVNDNWVENKWSMVNFIIA